MATEVAGVATELEAYAAELVATGRYGSVRDVVHAATEALKREQCDDLAKMAFLDDAIDAGFASGVAEGDVFARVRERVGLPPRDR